MRATLLNVAINAAVAIAVSPAGQTTLNDAPQSLFVQATFNPGSSGGTTVDAYLQTSVDGGLTWTDIAEFSFTTAAAQRSFNLSALTPVTTQYTPTTNSLTANTAKDGLLGPMFQVQYVTTGTYTNASLRIDISAKQP